MVRRHKGTAPPGMPIVLPLLAFMIWTMVAVLASSNVLLGLTIAKKFFLFLLVLVVPLIVRGEGRLTWIYKAVIAVAVLSSLEGLIQFAADPHRDLLHRITGFMSQWMTYSGLLMLVLVILTAYGLCNGLRNHKWVILAAHADLPGPHPFANSECVDGNHRRHWHADFVAKAARNCCFACGNGCSLFRISGFHQAAASIGLDMQDPHAHSH